MTRLDLRFAVRQSDGRQSRVWRLWSHQSDVYCAVRGIGGLCKISFHCARDMDPPICQLSITSELHRTLGRERQSPKGRHLERWARAGPDANGDFLGTRLLIPSESVRFREAEHSKPIVWLSAPNAGDAIEIALMFRPAGKHWLQVTATTGLDLLAMCELPNGEQFRAMAYKRTLSEEDRAMLIQLKTRVQADPPHWSSRDIGPDDTGLGLLLHGPQFDGGHRIVDLDYDGPPGAA